MASIPPTISQPSATPNMNASVNRFWALIDARVQTLVRSILGQWGTVRNRPLTVVVPLADSSGPPSPGWIQSVPVFASSHVAAWEIHALTPGQITLDLQLSAIQPGGPGVAPTLQPMNGVANYLSLNGYTVRNMDTSAWTKTDLAAGDVINIYVISASAIAEAVLCLLLTDNQSRVWQL